MSKKTDQKENPTKLDRICDLAPLNACPPIDFQSLDMYMPEESTCA